MGRHQPLTSLSAQTNCSWMALIAAATYSHPASSQALTSFYSDYLSVIAFTAGSHKKSLQAAAFFIKILLCASFCLSAHSNDMAYLPVQEYRFFFLLFK